ncbi:MAG: hypothetical protein R2684_03780 [Pyrinomonadaceae bacterium]
MKSLISTLFFLLLVSLQAGEAICGQPGVFPRGQEVDEETGLPVLVKHLPEWEAKQKSARYFVEENDLRKFLSARSIASAIEFTPGTEAVFADYDGGKLLIVEYMSPQMASIADKAIMSVEEGRGDDYAYRRIGNYCVFVFDPKTDASASALFEKVKYEKVVTWPLGQPDPYFEEEREFIIGTTSLFINTVLFIVAVFGLAIGIGALSGYIYFRIAQKKRAEMFAFSDAGGLTRLNIDGLSVQGSEDLPRLSAHSSGDED